METTTVLNPQQAAQQVLAALEKLADPVRARATERYFREQVSFYGLNTPAVREIAKGLHARVKSAWGLDEAIRFCQVMLEQEKFEARSVGILLLLKFQRAFGPDMAGKMKMWLANDRLDNWAAVDTLCPDGLGPLLERHPELAAELRNWTAHPNRWVQRASLVSYVKLARHGKMLDEAYENCRRLFSSSDDLIQKAMGWLLREAGKTDMARLEACLRKHGPSMPRTTVRYAIERFPEARRRELLQVTRPG
jgi:3-methyladenine DNA glycosylase AlkD